MNAHVRSVQDEVNAARGATFGAGAETVRVVLAVSESALESVTVNVTVYAPAAAYVCVPDAAVLVVPSPKVQDRVMIVPLP
jgi:hypothetical protein